MLTIFCERGSMLNVAWQIGYQAETGWEPLAKTVEYKGPHQEARALPCRIYEHYFHSLTLLQQQQNSLEQMQMSHCLHFTADSVKPKNVKYYIFKCHVKTTV